MRIARTSFPFGLADTTITTQLPLDANGFALVIKVVIPQCTDTPTATLTVYDLDGYAIFSKAAIAENTTTVIYAVAESKDIPVTPGANVSLTFTAAPVSVTPTVTFFVA